jgi:hypothetical protein
MATTFTSNTYAGNLFLPYFVPMVLNSRTIKDSLVNVIPNITGKEVIRKVDQSVVFQDNTLDFNASGGQVLSETILEPIRMSFQDLYDRDYVYRSWEASLVNPGVNKVSLPTELESAIFGLASERISSNIELLLWSGKGASSSVFTFTGTLNGFFGLAKAGAPVSQVNTVGSRGQLAFTGIANATGIVTVASTANIQSGDYVTIGSTTNGTQIFPATTGATIVGQTFPIKVLSATTFQLINPTTGAAAVLSGTAATSGLVGFINTYSVQDALVSLIQTLPNRVRYASKKATIYVSSNVMTAYKNSIAQSQSLTAGYLNFRQPEYVSNFTDKFQDFTVEAVPSILGNQMLAGISDNICVGTSLISDYDSMTIVDTRATMAGNGIRFRADWSLDAKIAFLDEVSYLDAAI